MTMTIDEALYELEAIKNPLWHRGHKDKYWGDAVSLSIEALKRCQILAKNDTYWAVRPLEGETK